GAAPLPKCFDPERRDPDRANGRPGPLVRTSPDETLGLPRVVVVGSGPLGPADAVRPLPRASTARPRAPRRESLRNARRRSALSRGARPPRVASTNEPVAAGERHVAGTRRSEERRAGKDRN